ncbi:helix-turn-helix domain containing protein [Leptospira sp. 96542]|nr:helix-turn-helix domain containing protein [Leptospira sp. 96542]
MILQRIPLRERKKRMIHSSIQKAAKKLFEEKGYQSVTVAEIADNANISVKTLFAYFQSKEDLAFQDEILVCDQLITALLSRPAGFSLFDAFSKFLWDLIHDIDSEVLLESLPGFHSWMEDEELEKRYLLLWHHYEERIADAIITEKEQNTYDPKVRVIANQMVSVMKVLGSKEFKLYLQPIPTALRPRALEKWLQGSLKTLGSGIQSIARR